jgi:hypothetical protein
MVANTPHTRRHTLRIMEAATAFLSFALLYGGGCEKDEKPSPQKQSDRQKVNEVPPPLKNPAGFCFVSCRRQALCRLGKPSNKEQKKIFAADVERCGHRCVEWIKSHPYDAAALHLCYENIACGKLMACLANTRRLLSHSENPQKKRECFKLCVDLGQCGGDEPRCLRLCKEGDLRVFRALQHCENRGCPQVKECFEKQFKSVK